MTNSFFNASTGIERLYKNEAVYLLFNDMDSGNQTSLASVQQVVEESLTEKLMVTASQIQHDLINGIGSGIETLKATTP
jgi:hypothetical protein